MPDIVSGGLLASQATCIFGPELLRPSPYRFVRYDNAALQQHFLDQAQAERKPEIKPDRVRDDLWREAMALIADGEHVHAIASIPKNADGQLK